MEQKCRSLLTIFPCGKVPWDRMRLPSTDQSAYVLITLIYRSNFLPANLSRTRRRVAEAKNPNRLQLALTSPLTCCWVWLRHTSQQRSDRKARIDHRRFDTGRSVFARG